MKLAQQVQTALARSVALILGSTLAWGAFGAEPSASGALPTSLVHLWTQARAHEPLLKAARHQVDAAQAQAREGRGITGVGISFQAGAALAHANQTTQGAYFSAPGMPSSSGVGFVSDSGAGLATRWAIQGSMPVFNREREAIREQLERAPQLAHLDLLQADQALALRVAQAWASVMIAEDTVRALNAQMASALRAAETAQARFDAGAAPITDSLEAQARVSSLKAQSAHANAQRRLAQQRLRDLTGVEAPTLGVLDLARIPAQALTWAPAEAATQHHAIEESPRLRRVELDVAQSLTETQKHAWASSVNVDMVIELADERLRGEWLGHETEQRQRRQRMGAQVSIPLFDGGVRSAREDQALARLMAAKEMSRATRIGLEQAVNEGLEWRSALAEKSLALEQALESATARLDATKTAHEVGARTLLEVLDAEQAHVHLEKERRSVRIEQMLNELHLAATLGKLNEGLLARIDAMVKEVQP